MLRLDTLANLAEIFSAATVVFGVVFAVIQLLHYRRQRSDLAAIELVRSFQNPEFINAIRKVLELPPQCSGPDLKAQGGDLEDAAMTVSLTIEAIGLMVYRRILHPGVVRDLMGGLIVGSWARLKCWAEQRREDVARGEFAEWHQWLAEQIEAECARDCRDPAFIRARNWK